MKLTNLFEAQQLTPDIISDIFRLADEIAQGPNDCLSGKIMASLFYEPSTRTRLSFESAMLRLGGEVIGTENALSFSSASKGESLEDTIRVISAYADVIVLRYFEQDVAKRLSGVAKVPIINAGDGGGQHPTQALLDLYTVKRELGHIDGTHVVAVGDLKYGRTIRSFAYLLGKYSDIHFTFVPLPGLEIGTDIKDYLRRHKVTFEESSDLETAMLTADVVFQTRLQKERSSVADLGSHQLIITRNMADSMKPGSIIMHPLPRNEEISSEVDDSPHAAYFKQPYYGLLIRMALLKYMLV